MKEIFKRVNLKNVLIIIALFLFGLCAVSFGVLYVEKSGIEFIKNNKILIKIAVVIVVSLITIISYLFSQNDDSFILKATLSFLVLATILTFVLYFVKVSGLENRIDNVDSLRCYILSYGRFVIPVFMVLQFLQVLVLPIPSAILLGAGIAVFGILWGAILSYISIVLASIVAFIIGKKFGIKAVGWLIGKNSLDKGLKLINGKDKIFLSFMLIFPFFPDDLLCFMAGLTTISYKYFIFIISVTRFLNIGFFILFLSGKFLPFYTWWGIAILLIFFLLTVIICIYLYKNGENIEKCVKKVFNRKYGKNYSSRRFK